MLLLIKSRLSHEYRRPSAALTGAAGEHIHQKRSRQSVDRDRWGLEEGRSAAQQQRAGNDLGDVERNLQMVGSDIGQEQKLIAGPYHGRLSGRDLAVAMIDDELVAAS